MSKSAPIIGVHQSQKLAVVQLRSGQTFTCFEKCLNCLPTWRDAHICGAGRSNDIRDR